MNKNLPEQIDELLADLRKRIDEHRIMNSMLKEIVMIDQQKLDLMLNSNRQHPSQQPGQGRRIAD